MGLMGRKGLPEGAGLFISPCSSIHSFFMRFSFDALFLDSNNEVVHIIHSMPPYRVSQIISRAVGVLELPAGAAVATETVVGDRLEFLEGALS